MKKLFLLVTAMLLLTACQESIEKRLAREAREITEKGPQTLRIQGTDGIAHIMILDSIVFDIPTLTQRQYFTLTGDIDNEGAAPSRDALILQLKNEPAYDIHRKNGYSFYYLYRSAKDPQTVYFETTITKADYSR